MNFDEMLIHLRNGSKIRHFGWNENEYMYIDSTHRSLNFNTVSDDRFMENKIFTEMKNNDDVWEVCKQKYYLHEILTQELVNHTKISNGKQEFQLFDDKMHYNDEDAYGPGDWWTEYPVTLSDFDKKEWYFV